MNDEDDQVEDEDASKQTIIAFGWSFISLEYYLSVLDTHGEWRMFSRRVGG